MKLYISERIWHPYSSFWIVNWFMLLKYKINCIIVDLLFIFTIKICIMYQIRPFPVWFTASGALTFTIALQNLADEIQSFQ